MQGRPFKPGHKKTGGRKKGTPNKFTTVKQAFLNAFERTGGEEELAKWGKKNPSKFYPLIARMLPNRIENELPERPDMSMLPDETIVAMLKEAVHDQENQK